MTDLVLEYELAFAAFSNASPARMDYDTKREKADLARVRLSEAAALGGALEGVVRQAMHNHETYSATGSLEDDVRFFALGLTGEAGEVMDALLLAAGLNGAAGRVSNLVKKRWRDGDEHLEDLRDEAADVFAYNVMLAWKLGMSPIDLVRRVTKKQLAFVAKMKAKEAAGPES